MNTQNKTRASSFAVFAVLSLGLSGLAHAAVTVSGEPQGWMRAGSTYQFQPKVSGANGTVSFTISNKPRWASFSATTGKLAGLTAETDAGWYNNITIYAKDKSRTVKLNPYNLRVAPNASAPANTAPTIAGTAPASAYVGRDYSFKATAKDANGDKLTYSIKNTPVWAKFDTSTGTLSGKPTAASITANIVISVTDGKATASLAAFTVTAIATKGSVVLNWAAPTKNEDNSTLTNLAGYKVVYGTAANKLDKSLQISDSNVETVSIEELDAGTHYFAVRAYTTSGMESALSEVVYKLIQ